MRIEIMNTDRSAPNLFQKGVEYGKYVVGIILVGRLGASQVYGRFSKVHVLYVLPDPGRFELSKGMLK